MLEYGCLRVQIKSLKISVPGPNIKGDKDVLVVEYLVPKLEELVLTENPWVYAPSTVAWKDLVRNGQ